jgi:sulfate permease, SulP family
MAAIANSFSGQEWVQVTLGFFSRPLRILRNYPREDFRPDLLAGLSIAAVVLPQAIAYSLLAELPPQFGIFTAILAAFFASLWGSSPHLYAGPSNTISLLVLSSLLPIATPGTPEYLATAGLIAVMVGIAQLLMGIARLGVLVNFVSDSVIVGFMAGTGLLIGAHQLRHILGLQLLSTPEFSQTIWQVINQLPEVHAPSLGIGLGTLVIVALLKRYRRRWPAALIGLVIASAVVAIFHLDQAGVAVLGEFPRTFPPFARLPIFNLTLIGRLSTGALAVTSMGLIQTLVIARSFASQSGQYLDSNQEFVGQGMANLAAGFFSGYPCSGSFVLSAMKKENGGRTAIANMFTGLFVLVAVLLVAPLAVYLPRASLASVLLVTAYGLVDRREMKRIWHTSLGDGGIMVATLLASVLLPLEFAVLAGVLVSFVRFIVKSSRPSVYSVVPSEDYRHFVPSGDRTYCPQVAVMTISGSLYFGATHHVETAIRQEFAAHPAQKLLLLRLHLVDYCDITGIHVLETIVQIYRKQHGKVYIAGVRPPVMERMKLAGFDQLLGEDHFLSRDDAVGYLFYNVLDPAICVYQCPYRVFAECQALPKYDYSSPIPTVSFLDHEVQSWQPNELKWYLEQEGLIPELLVVDVREPREYEAGHIPQAQLLPMRLIPHQGRDLPKDQAIVLICRTGRRSRLAAGILQDMGFTHVFNLEGGILAWEGAGYPIAKEFEEI